MSDLIWTIIVIWLVYKLVSIFKTDPAKSTENNSRTSSYNQNQTTQTPKRDLNSALKKHLNNEGEYVDFEEVK